MLTKVAVWQLASEYGPDLVVINVYPASERRGRTYRYSAPNIGVTTEYPNI